MTKQPEPPPVPAQTKTTVPPGTVAKLATMMARADAGEEVFHKDDTKEMSHEQGQHEFLHLPGNPTNQLGAPRVYRDITNHGPAG